MISTRPSDDGKGVILQLRETEGKNEIGLTIGLAWTEVGGELLSIEASVMEGTGKMVMTGKLGDVMQESVQAALTYIRARAEKFGLPKDFYKEIGPMPDYTNKWSVDRIDNNRGYVEGNIRWCLMQQQAISTKGGKLLIRL